jgi:hypothetical protein
MTVVIGGPIRRLNDGADRFDANGAKERGRVRGIATGITLALWNVGTYRSYVKDVSGVLKLA